MKLLFSVPSGYHLRELVLPLRSHLEAAADVEQVYILTPAADLHQKIFAGFGTKFSYHKNPIDFAGHAELLQSLKPDIVVTNTVGHDPLDYPPLKAAHELGIPSLTFIASWDNVWKISRLIKSNIPVHVADSVIVWNEMMNKHMQKLFSDLAPERISVIGAPRLDYFWRDDAIPSKEKVYDLLGFSDTSKPFIHFSTTELYPMDYVVETIAKAIRNNVLPDTYLYASVHPGGDVQNHENLKTLGATVRYSFGRVEAPPHPSFAYIPTESDILNLVGVFKHAGLLINQSSTTALESLVAGVPVVNVQYGRSLDWWRWYRSMVYRDFKQHYADLVRDNATYLVHSNRELVQATKKALQRPTAKHSEGVKTIQRMITTTDGTAGQKVLTEIKKRAKKASLL